MNARRVQTNQQRQPAVRSAPPGPTRPVRVETVAPDAPAEVLTPRLHLRPLIERDRDAFCTLYDNSRAHLETFLPLGAADQAASSIFDRQLELTADGDRTGKAFRRIAIEQATGEIIGAFNLVVVRRGLEWDADVSCWLAEGMTSKGYASEGLAALLSYSFADLPEGLGLHAIHGFIAPENIASQRLAKAYGFKQQENAATHLSVGDRWQVHEKWSLPIRRWQTLAS